MAWSESRQSCVSAWAVQVARPHLEFPNRECQVPSRPVGSFTQAPGFRGLKAPAAAPPRSGPDDGQANLLYLSTHPRISY